MLWSQIKLPAHDFSDLQITGEFSSRPGTGRCSTYFSLRLHKSYERRPASVYNQYHRPMLSWLFRDQPGTVRCPAIFTRLKHFSRAMIHTSLVLWHSCNTGMSVYVWFSWSVIFMFLPSFCFCDCFVLVCDLWVLLSVVSSKTAIWCYCVLITEVSVFVLTIRLLKNRISGKQIVKQGHWRFHNLL